MILTCPQCDTRYQADGSKFPAAGRNVRCAKCGHVWHQLGPVPEPDPEAELFVEEPPQEAPAQASRAPEPEQVVIQPRVAAFTPPVVDDPDEATTTVVPETSAEPRASLLTSRAAVMGGWAALVLLILVIGWAAISFRDNVATWVPQTASFYNAAGLTVSPKGIAFTDVAYQNQTEDGQVVLAVTGKIVNRSNHELTVPLVRVALFDADGHELYHWTFVPGVATLQPGGSAKFRTRLSSPPAGTHNLKVSFAKAGE